MVDFLHYFTSKFITLPFQTFAGSQTQVSTVLAK